MKRFILLSFFYFILISGFAANWHPFPFGVTYWGKRDVIMAPTGAFSEDTLAKGMVTDAMRLDTSWTNAQGTYRVNKEFYYFQNQGNRTYNKQFRPFFLNIEVKTSLDSQTVTLTNVQPTNPVNPSGTDVFYFYPFRTTLGQLVFKANVIGANTSDFHEDDYNASGYLTSVGVGQVFGVLDSIRIISLGDREVRWSKSFGILGLPGLMDELIGIEELSLGLQDYDSHGQSIYPIVGDTIHYKRIYSHHGPPTAYFSSEDVRESIMEYPYNGNSGRAKYRVVYSSSGSPYAIEAHEVRDVGYQSVNRLGQMENLYFNSGWLGENGLYVRIRILSFFIDGGTNYGIQTCGYSAPLGRKDESGFVEYKYLLSFPFFYSVHDQCAGGTRFAPVTVTSMQNQNLLNDKA